MLLLLLLPTPPGVMSNVIYVLLLTISTIIVSTIPYLQEMYGNGNKEKDNANPVALFEEHSSAVIGKQSKERQDFDCDYDCHDLDDLTSINDLDDDDTSVLDTYQDPFNDDDLETDKLFKDLPILFGNEKL
jgi:hypothetical protein